MDYKGYAKQSDPESMDKFESFDREMGRRDEGCDPAERRKYIRLDFEVKVKVSVTEQEQKHLSVVSNNLSVEGIRISLPKKVSPGPVIGLDISLPGMPKMVHLQGEVVWSREMLIQTGQKDHFYDTGVKLMNMDGTDEGKFLIYICSHMMRFFRR